MYELPLAPAILYAVLDARPIRADRFRKEMQALLPCSDIEFADALAQLQERRLLWQDGGVRLGLAVPAEISERHQASQWPRKWNSIYV